MEALYIGRIQTRLLSLLLLPSFLAEFCCRSDFIHVMLVGFLDAGIA